MNQGLPKQQFQDFPNIKPESNLQQIPTGMHQEGLYTKKNQPSLVDDLLIHQTKNIVKELKEIREKIQDQKTEYRIVSDKIYSLPSDDWQLLTPINIIIKISSKEVIALIPDLELYSDGRNEIEAVSNLKLEILDLIDNLDEIPESQLGKNPKSWKKSLSILVEKCQ